MAFLSITEVKKGMVLKINRDLFSVVKSEFVNPGKGSAFIRTKLRNIEKQSTIEKTFKASEKLESVELEKKHMTICYVEGDYIVFMDVNDYEQISIPKSFISDVENFVKEDTQMEVFLYNENPVYVTPPNFINLKVDYAEDGLRGDTVSGTAMKKVTLETGGEIDVPIFVKKDDVIKIDLRELKYVERVKV